MGTFFENELSTGGLIKSDTYRGSVDSWRVSCSITPFLNILFSFCFYVFNYLHLSRK
jgi:hypothetical protein